MAESGYDINDLVREAQIRWLKPAEVLFILRNHENHQLSSEPPQKPPSGSLFLFNKRVLRFFRKDGHSWRKKKDGRTVGEAHERLKVGNAEALNCYYAHGEQNPNFQRRSYWMLDPAYDHIVLVHYRDITEGRQNPVFMSESSPISSAFSPSPRSYSTQHTGSTVIASESYELYQNQSSPGEICSDAVINNSGTSDTTGRTEEPISSPGLEMSQALRRLEEQLSLNDDSFKEIDPLYADAINDDSSFIQMQGNSNGLLLQHHLGESSESHHQDLTQDSDMWKDMLDDYGVSAAAESQTKYLHKLDENAMLQISSERCAIETYGSYKWPCFSDKEAPTAQVPDFKQLEDFKYPTYPPDINTFGSNPDKYTTLFDQDHIGTSLEDEVSLTIAQKQKFTIRDISPDWGYSSEATKVVIIGSFLCNPSECTWACMFGDIEVPVQIIQEGVICCQAPRHLPGKVTLCVTSGNRESCSEVREFEYRVEPDDCARNNQPDVVGAYQSSEELLLLVRFVQLLLSDLSVQKGDSSELANDFLEKSKANEDSWSQVIESLLFGTSTSMITIDWLLQELLKDKFQQWLYCKLQQKDNQIGCSLSKKEQGIIHMVAGLGYEWALHPILNAGLSVNFRDINGWTALHWAARFGREKMVASLIASGASAGAVTDPSSRDPVGKTAASIASSCGHKGLAGYLSEVALTSHLSSLTLEQSELSKGTPWPVQQNNNGNNENHQNGVMGNKDDMEIGALSTFKSMMEAEDVHWYNMNSNQNNNGGGGNIMQSHHHDINMSFAPNFNEVDNNNLLPVDSSSSCSPSPGFNSLDPSQVNFFMPPKSTIPPLLSGLDNSFDLGGFHDLSSHNQMGHNSLTSFPQFACSNMLPMPQATGGFGSIGFGVNPGNESVGNSLILNRSKLLKPLDNFASIGAQPTLFQKRAALRKNLGNIGGKLGVLGAEIGQSSSNKEVNEANERKRKFSNGDDLDDLSVDGSTLNYDSDDFVENSATMVEESTKTGGNSSNTTSTVTTGVDQKGKKKGLPAKNLMAERRRRKKLNDRLYMLRSVVPKISKMDRASILGDAIEYLRELLQTINDLHNELEATPPASSSLTQASSFYPLTPTTQALPGRIKEELCASSFASPLSSPTGQPARVEVRAREGRAVNIHMFCSRKPGLLLSTMRALDSLGLDVQQAVISCFNGFALDIFRAEQSNEGQDIPPEQIKAVLLDSAGFHGGMI